MKTIHPLSFLAAALLGCTSLLPAQEETAPPKASENGKVVPAWQLAFQNLKTDQQAAFNKHLFEASRLFQQKRIIESLNEVREAQKIFDQHPTGYNLLGACHVEFRSFGKARKAFQTALELQGEVLESIKGLPDDERIEQMQPLINILFNLAEMDFVTRKWQECHDRIEKILPDVAPENTTMARLIEFKYLLCKIRLEQVEEARKLSKKYDFHDDYPFYYYAQAAMCYHDGEEEEAERWRATARKVFRSSRILAPWEDTMIEFGYIKSFYGGVGADSE